MSQLTETATLRHSDSIRQSDNQDGAVLLDIRKGQCFSMNPVAALIWRQIGEGLRPSEIAEDLARRFEISLDQAVSDVQEFVQQLKREQLLQQVEDERTRHSGLERLASIPGRLWNHIWRRGIHTKR